MTKARKQKLKELYLATSSTKEVLSDFLDRLEVLDERFKKISSMPEFMDEIAEMMNDLEHRFGGLKTTPGPQGKPGMNGIHGQKGKPGQDGSPDSPEQIRDKISSLEGKARLSVLALKDTEWLRKWINGYENGNVIGTPGRFIDLLDAPDSYIGKSLMGVRVNAAETGLEFYVTGGGGSQNLQQTTDNGNTTTDRVRIGSSVAPDFELDVSGKASQLIGPVFTGSGLDDLSLVTASWNLTYDASYVFTIDGLASPYITIQYAIFAGTVFTLGDIVAGDDGSVGTIVSLTTDGHGAKFMQILPAFGDFSSATQVDNGLAYASVIRWTGAQAYDTFSVKKNGNSYLNGQAITGGTQSFSGISISFAAISGHSLGDFWTITALNNNVVNTSGSYRMQSPTDPSHVSIGAQPFTDNTEYLWPIASAGDSSDKRFLRNINGVMSWDNTPQILSIGETVNGAIPGRYFSADETTGTLKQGNSNGYILQESSGLRFANQSMVIADTIGNIAYQFDLGPHGSIKLGDFSGFWGSGMAEYLDLQFSTYKLANNGLTTFEDLFSNPFISLDIGSKIYGFGDLNGSFNGTKLVIEDGSGLAKIMAQGMKVQDFFGTDTFSIDTVSFLSTFGTGMRYPIQRLGGNWTFSIEMSTMVQTTAGATNFLPSAASFQGQVFTYKNAAGGSTTLSRSGTDSIYSILGLVTSILVADGASYTVQSDGINWNVI